MKYNPETAPLPKTFSTSQVTTYLTCPRQYAYKYVLRIPTLVTPEAMEKGSRIHAAIADGTDLPNPDEQQMVDKARRYLQEFPEDPILETTYEDRQNPGRLRGEVCGYNFVGIFDVHWTEPALGVDWKTGKYKPKYSTNLETQGYILGELYRNKYDAYMDEIAFVFLRTGDVHYAKSIREGRSRDAAEKRIEKAVNGAQARDFDKKRSPLCNYCEHKAICDINAGFRE